MSVRRTLILTIALLLVLSASASAASKTVDWAFSGAAIGGVAMDDSDCSYMTLIDVEAKGSQGKARIFGLNRKCSEGGENSLVARFKDGSLLNMLADKSQPTQFEFIPPNTTKITFWIYFNGGFGRFMDATGTAKAELYAAPVGEVEVAPGVFEPSLLVYEYGTFTETIDY